MAKGYWRVQRYQVFYGEQSSVYASTEKQAVKLAKKHNGMAIECDGGRVVYPAAQHSVEPTVSRRGDLLKDGNDMFGLKKSR